MGYYAPSAAYPLSLFLREFSALGEALAVSLLALELAAQGPPAT